MERRGHTRGRRLRLTAVAALVVLALTGFSTGRGHGSSSHGGGDGGGGGGCSSSRQDHDSSSSSGGSSSSGTSGSHYDDYDDDYTDDDHGDGTGSGSGGSSALQDAEAVLVGCAGEETPYATVEVTNPNAVAGTFTVNVGFYDARGDTVVLGSADVDVPANGTATGRVEVGDSKLLPRIDDCEVDLYAPPAT
ncbi:hypothetical protein ACH4F6_12815 [Streptomyces sp. NPDC017936]|uniref:hypothetical protein n=1 Tax=Streptomyces sp. NPDC017936 TaxID=3365016 RepID=UPI00379046E9